MVQMHHTEGLVEATWFPRGDQLRIHEREISAVERAFRRDGAWSLTRGWHRGDLLGTLVTR